MLKLKCQSFIIKSSVKKNQKQTHPQTLPPKNTLFLFLLPQKGFLQMCWFDRPEFVFCSCWPQRQLGFKEAHTDLLHISRFVNQVPVLISLTTHPSEIKAVLHYFSDNMWCCQTALFFYPSYRRRNEMTWHKIYEIKLPLWHFPTKL